MVWNLGETWKISILVIWCIKYKQLERQITFTGDWSFLSVIHTLIQSQWSHLINKNANYVTTNTGGQNAAEELLVFRITCILPFLAELTIVDTSKVRSQITCHKISKECTWCGDQGGGAMMH